MSHSSDPEPLPKVTPTAPNFPNPDTETVLKESLNNLLISKVKARAILARVSSGNDFWKGDDSTAALNFECAKKLLLADQDAALCLLKHASEYAEALEKEGKLVRERAEKAREEKKDFDGGVQLLGSIADQTELFKRAIVTMHQAAASYPNQTAVIAQKDAEILGLLSRNAELEREIQRLKASKDDGVFGIHLNRKHKDVEKDGAIEHAKQNSVEAGKNVVAGEENGHPRYESRYQRDGEERNAYQAIRKHVAKYVTKHDGKPYRTED